jgi:hypothetical protein
MRFLEVGIEVLGRQEESLAVELENEIQLSTVER